jgi:hypothetical protein
LFQKNALWRGVDFVVGTPGRVLDHINHGNLILEKIKYLVLDEADRMLDMGFQDDVQKIVDAVPSLAAFSKGESKTKDVQTLLFSATLPAWIKVCPLSSPLRALWVLRRVAAHCRVCVCVCVRVCVCVWAGPCEQVHVCRRHGRPYRVQVRTGVGGRHPLHAAGG